MAGLTMVKMEVSTTEDLTMVVLTMGKMVDLTMGKMGDLTMEVSTMDKMGDSTMEVSIMDRIMAASTTVVSTMVNVAVNADPTSRFNTTVEFKETVEHPMKQVYFSPIVKLSREIVQDYYRNIFRKTLVLYNRTSWNLWRSSAISKVKV